MESEDGVRDHEIHSKDTGAIRARVGVDITRDGAGMLQYIAPLDGDVHQVHFHMFANSTDVRDLWLLACAHPSCPTDDTMIPLDVVEVWKRAATPHQIWLLNWQQRCEITLANRRRVVEDGKK